MKINGNIEAINEVLVNTRNGKSPKTNIKIDGKTYSMWGSDKSLAIGSTVSFDYETKGIFNNITSAVIKCPIQQESKEHPLDIPAVREPIEKDLLKQMAAKISQLESQVNILTTICDQYNDRISLLADTNKTLNDRVRRLEDINRDIEATKTGN